MKNNALYREIAKQFRSVKELYRKHRQWLPSLKVIHDLVDLKISPRNQYGQFLESCECLSDVLGIPAEDLFPKRLYRHIQRPKPVFKINSFSELPFVVARKVMELPNSTEEPAALVELQEDLEELKAAMLKLPKHQRQALELRYGFGDQPKARTLQEIAVIQKVQKETVRQRILAGIKRLRELLAGKKKEVPFYFKKIRPEVKKKIPVPFSLKEICPDGHPIVGPRPGFFCAERAYLKAIMRQLPLPLKLGVQYAPTNQEARQILQETEIQIRLAGYPDELKALGLRYGLDCTVTHSFREIGHVLGSSSMQSSSLVCTGLCRLMCVLALKPLQGACCLLCEHGVGNETEIESWEEPPFRDISRKLEISWKPSTQLIIDILRQALVKIANRHVKNPYSPGHFYKIVRWLPKAHDLEGLVLRFGVNCGKIHPYQAIADALELPKNCAVQLASSALKTIHHILE